MINSKPDSSSVSHWAEQDHEHLYCVICQILCECHWSALSLCDRYELL